MCRMEKSVLTPKQTRIVTLVHTRFNESESHGGKEEDILPPL